MSTLSHSFFTFSIVPKMGFVYLIFALMSFLFEPLSCQEQQQQQQPQPNTDGYFVSEFFKRMNSTTSPSKISQTHNLSLPVCSWQGVFCDPNREHVVELVASNLGLSGPIPDTTIGKLTKLQSLDLSSNNITALPADFWSLGSLKSLNLSSNAISGSLPNDVGNFALLESLDVSGNRFSGPIPQTVGSIYGLRAIRLDRNGFDQTVPSGLIRCQSLVSIDLSLNRLSGPLPEGFGAAFPKLRALSLAGNGISGRGSDFSGMNSIATLNVSGNLFEGSAAGMLKEALEVVDLSKNRFRGRVSEVRFEDWPHLVYLDLSENELSGEISFHLLSQARNLKHLNLASNGFSWQKFPGTELPLGLEYLNLSKTGLVDEIPGDISRLSNLHTLDLSNNRLVGCIPLLSVKSLQVLDLSLNRLTGDIPASIVDKLPYMERFNFSYNDLRLCASKFGPETRRASFFGSSLDNCPIAANSSLFRRPAGPRHRGGLKLALALALSMVFALAGLLFLAFGCRRRRRGTWMWAAAKQNSYKEEQSVSGPFSFQTDSTTWTADVKQANSVPVVIFEKPLLNVTFADLLSATSSFDRGTLLAEGKFGPVYRGFLPGGTHAAVKVLVHGSTLTDREAARELEYLGQIKHPNLVPLTGYCLAGDQRLAIYDYMENGNLQNLLHDLPLGVLSPGEAWDDDENIIRSVGSEGLLTSWKFRHKIALGTARALAFLHHGCFPPIVHRDVKASSVYLDYNLEPRLSDFGLARVFGNGLDEEIARGSPGYLPPELSKPAAVEGGDYSVTPKSDVYCFGVVLFELVTGKKPVGDEYPEEKEGTLVGWVRELVRKSRASRAIDPKIRGTGPQDQMVEALKIGYLCTADLPSKRPTMQQIVGLLKDIIIVDPANASTQ